MKKFTTLSIVSCLVSMRSFAYVGILCLVAGNLSAQVSSTAFDKNCYQPRIGIEIDTVYGDTAGQNLGNFLMKMPPRPGQQYGDVLFTGMRDNIPNLSAIKTGTGFNLHNLEVTQKMNFKATSAKFGHFHDRDHWDMLVYGSTADNGLPTIYWGDDSGFYDVGRKTQLTICVDYPYKVFPRLKSYIAHLSSDTIQDIVIGFDKAHYSDSNGVDSVWFVLGLFKGGNKLFNSGTIACKDSLALVYDGDSYLFEMAQGDLRGVGQEDLMAINIETNNCFYYKNDHSIPFALSDIATSLNYDTLTTGIHAIGFPMKALPKEPGDSSEDVLIGINTLDFTTQAVYVFKGGKDFGTKRLSLSEADKIIRTPAYYDASFIGLQFPGYLEDIGDPTGTGNPVLSVGAMNTGAHYNFCYVLGKAFDDKVDMFTSVDLFDGAVGNIAITANTDNKDDILRAIPGAQTEADHNKGWEDVGSLQLIHGTDKIPVRLNGVVNNSTNLSESVSLRNSILDRQVILELVTDHSEPIQIILRDIMGREVYRISRFSIGGTEEFRVLLPQLSSGRYQLEILTPINRLATSILIIH
jgi:hypothetical protein